MTLDDVGNKSLCCRSDPAGEKEVEMDHKEGLLSTR
jgi:hypothetical protein